MRRSPTKVAVQQAARGVADLDLRLETRGIIPGDDLLVQGAQPFQELQLRPQVVQPGALVLALRPRGATCSMIGARPNRPAKSATTTSVLIMSRCTSL